MGKATGFLDYERKANAAEAPLERIRHWNEFHPMLEESERQKQGARCMECGVPFCQSGTWYGKRFAGCPLHNLIPEWNDLICSGNYGHAYRRLKKTNNFPEFTGRVCPALCEAACTCSIHGDSVTVKENELFTIETAWANGLIQPHPPAHRSGKRVAIVGSGPAGLAAADQLNHRGHSVTVYERDDRIGGLLMYGIPNMKLEKRIIDRRVALMQAEGVEFVTSCDIGRDLSAGELLEKFDAILLCCGSQKVRTYTVSGHAAGVHYATDYLKTATKALLDGTAAPAEVNAKDKNVVVIGAGDTSCDCVATAIRQGCRSIVQLVRRTADFYAPAEKAWPDLPHGNSDYGDEEATALFGKSPKTYGVAVKELIPGEDGALRQVKTVQLRWTKDENGRFVSREIPGAEALLDAELLLIASGFAGCEEYVCDAFGITRDKRENAAVVSGHQTANEKIFVAGDMRRGASLVVWAIAEGRAAASEVDCYLMHYTNQV